MKLQSSKQYLQELDAANQRYGRMLDVFRKFYEGASHLGSPAYPLKGIEIGDVSPTSFTARFLGTSVRFSFLYNHVALRGVVVVTAVSPEGEPAGPNWSFHFDGQGEVGEIEPRQHEGLYNIAVDTDAAEIVLGALHIALVGKIEVV